MKKIKKIIELYKTKKILNNKTKQNKIYLKEGKYKYFTPNSLVHKKSQNLIKINFYDKFNTGNSSLEKLIKSIISIGKVKIKNNQTKKYEASLILLTHQNKSIMMFDFKNKVIITKYFNKDIYDETINNYNHFRKHFRVPNILETNDQELIIIEELLKYKQTSLIDEHSKDKLMEDILINYRNYISKNISNIQFKNNINEDLSLIFKDNLYPTIKSLGDLMYKNILFKDDEFYYIDFELSNNNFILYDLFTFIYYAYYNNGEIKYFKNYINGIYDNFIKTIFNEFGIFYDTTKKELYFNIYLKERIKEEKKYASDFNENNFLLKYEEMIKLTNT